MIIDNLIEKIISMKNPTCVGLDTDFDYLPPALKEQAHDLKTAANAILEFNKHIIDHIHDLVPAVKIQIAYYEMYGYWGLKTFYDTLLYAKQKGLIIIADAKRNDIGSTASCYAKAFLGKTLINKKSFEAFPSDFLTVNAYLGSDGIIPFTKEGKGIFILVKTSNPSSNELQDKTLSSGETIFEYIGKWVSKWGKSTIGKYGYSNVGAVIGATHKEQATILRKILKHTFFLIPGYGIQGGNAQDLKVCFNKEGIGGIVNSSRGLICAYKTPL
ncbi:MAG: orotidine-5'-phosphate decarboxylase, partial [Chitinophagaceae bacterium]